MATERTEQPTPQELWTLLQDQRDALLEQQNALVEQRAQIAHLQALVHHPDHHVAGAENHKASVAGEVVSRAGLLKAAAMGAAGVAGAGALLQQGAGVAGATGSEGQTTFSSATTTPTVTVNNTSTGLAIKTSGSIQTSKGVTAKTVTATNPSTAANANAVVGQISSTSPGLDAAGVRGQSLSTSDNGYGVYGSQNGIGTGVYGTVSGAGTGGAFTASRSGGGNGVYGSGDTAINGNGNTYGGYFVGSTGIHGEGTIGGAFYGSASGNEGVYASGTSGAYGLYAISDSGNGVEVTAGGYNGVSAIATGESANGVVGEADTGSIPYGVWGYTSVSSGYGVYCTGNFAATGTKSAVVPAADGSHRKLYCVESPECWFEDFGSAQLVNGHASVTVDPVFAGVVHTDLYHIFLTANGDSKGLYVSNRSASGFEVREQEGGKSSLTFSYRVVAKRKDVVAPRLEQVTLKERPARQAPRILPQPTPKKPVLDPNPEVNVVHDPTA